jgi:single-strand DNA-binding protein
MPHIPVTLVGNVASDVSHRLTTSGVSVTSFRMACTARRRDEQGWVDGDTSFVTVTCWRQLGEHVASSIDKGQPIVVTGRLQVKERKVEDRKFVDVEVVADAVGTNLRYGTTIYRKAARPDQPDQPDHSAHDVGSIAPAA